VEGRRGFLNTEWMTGGSEASANLAKQIGNLTLLYLMEWQGWSGHEVDLWH
jgi:hypothetical protein